MCAALMNGNAWTVGEARPLCALITVNRNLEHVDKLVEAGIVHVMLGRKASLRQVS